jgi:hypothetical protein
MSLIRQTDQIPDAATVRRLLKAKGFTAIKVKRSHSPWSGDVYFNVSTPTPPGVAVVYDSGCEAHPGEKFFSDDAGRTAGNLQSLAAACKAIEAESRNPQPATP